MVVDVERSPTLRISRPRVRLTGNYIRSNAAYAVAPDGGRVLMVKQLPEPPREPLVFVRNWSAEPGVCGRNSNAVLDSNPSAPYTRSVEFRDRLLATIAAARSVLEEPGVLVVGSEVPNLLEPDAASTLVVSQDLDVGVPVERHRAVKERLVGLRDFRPSPDEPSVWAPRSADLLELNFVGIDRAQDPAEAYVLADDRLPLLVFGALSLVTPGAELELAGVRLRLPRPAGLLLEKLVTDRTGEKGERDLLVALGLLLLTSAADLDEVAAGYRRLRPELRHVVRSNLTLLSLLGPRAGMPDPRSRRSEVNALLRRLEVEDVP